ncbi:ComF operon protein C [Enterococcus phoeniculicola]|nr:ComF operon protein C [Enterococcus phoeniculicola]
MKPFKRFVICPLPLSFVRIEKRGFNQVEGILEAAEITSIQLLKRIELAPQSDKNRKARLLMPQPYTLATEKKQITNRSILLVDDVYTTGRTLFHAAEILLSASPKRLETLTLAR